MDDKMTKLYYGALLHDIGKAVQRAQNSRRKHSAIGGEFLKAFTDDEEILNSLKYHHRDEINSYSRYLREDSLSYITYIADNIASGTDRRKEDPEDSQKFQWNNQAALTDIFDRFGSEQTKRYLHPGELHIDDLDKMVPGDKEIAYTQGEYARGVDYFQNGLGSISFTSEYTASVLTLLEATMSFMPSSTNQKEEADISLYDHMKLTAAYATALKQFLDDQKISDYYHKLYRESSKFYKRQAFTMVGYDFVGIKKFITMITSKGAHKQLRSRAFYVEMLIQNFLDELLAELNLTSANILYADSGHGYFIMGNTTHNKEIVRQKQKDFNAFLLKQFGTHLYLAIGMANFSSEQVRENNSSRQYVAIFREIDKNLRKQEQQPYDGLEVMKLNISYNQGRECAICHAVSDLLEDENKCYLCYGLELFSAEIQNEDFFLVNDDINGLPLDDHHYLTVLTEEEIKTEVIQGRVYSKNQLNTGLMQNSYLWISDYSQTENNDYSYYAERTWTVDNLRRVTGIKRLGSLMIDVDDLYAGFLAGFHQQGEGRFTTIGRYATLSRRIEIFFKLYLDHFAENYHLSIIYSQGDDIFILGAWDDLLDFVGDLHDNFQNWTAGKLTFSAGLGMFNAKTPINIIARKTQELLDEAKLAGKNRIVLYHKDNNFTFEDFTNRILWDKLARIRNFFDQESEHGKSFIYKLLDLIEERNNGIVISFARIAYLLARLEESSRHKDNFKRFKQDMMLWFENDQEIHQVQVALMLYVYEIRTN